MVEWVGWAEEGFDGFGGEGGGEVFGGGVLVEGGEGMAQGFADGEGEHEGGFADSFAAVDGPVLGRVFY